MLVPGHRGTGRWRRRGVPSPETPGDAERSVSAGWSGPLLPGSSSPHLGSQGPGTVATQPLLLISLFAVLCVFLTAGFHGNLHGYFLEFSVSGRDSAREGATLPREAPSWSRHCRPGKGFGPHRGWKSSSFPHFVGVIQSFILKDPVWLHSGIIWGMKTLALA